MFTIMVFHTDEAAAQRAAETLRDKGYVADGTSDEATAERFVETMHNAVCLMFTTGNYSTSEWFVPPGSAVEMGDLLRVQEELKAALGEDKGVEITKIEIPSPGGS